MNDYMRTSERGWDKHYACDSDGSEHDYTEFDTAMARTRYLRATNRAEVGRNTAKRAPGLMYVCDDESGVDRQGSQGAAMAPNLGEMSQFDGANSGRAYEAGNRAREVDAMMANVSAFLAALRAAKARAARQACTCGRRG